MSETKRELNRVWRIAKRRRLLFSAAMNRGAPRSVILKRWQDYNFFWATADRLAGRVQDEEKSDSVYKWL